MLAPTLATLIAVCVWAIPGNSKTVCVMLAPIGAFFVWASPGHSTTGGVRFAPIVDFFVCAGPGHSKQGCVLLARSLLFNTTKGQTMKRCLNRAMHFEYIHCRSVACSCSGLFISVVAQAHRVLSLVPISGSSFGQGMSPFSRLDYYLLHISPSFRMGALKPRVKAVCMMA